MNLKKAISQYLDYYLQVERGMPDNTLAAYKNDLNLFYNIIGNKNINHLHDTDFTKFLSQSTGARSTLHRRKATLNGFIKFLNKRLKCNIEFRFESTRQCYADTVPHYLTLYQGQKFFQSIDTKAFPGIRDYAIFITLLATGCRVSTLINIKLSDIDYKHKHVKIKGKGSKERLIPLDDTTIKSILSWILFRTGNFKQKSEYIFTNKTGAKISRESIFLITKKYQKKAGLDISISPHSFRHTFGTWLIHSGANLKDIQSLMGHRTIDSTQIYLHTDAKHLRAAIQKHPLHALLQT